MCKSPQPCAFLTLSTIMVLAIFVLTLLNMIFTIQYPSCTTFVEPKLVDYDIAISQSYLSDIEFIESYDNQGTGFGQTGDIKKKCYEGYCHISSHIIYDVNCSYACLYSQNYCFINGEKCNQNCSLYSSQTEIGKCAYYNKIYYWKGYQSNLVLTNYSFSILNDTVTYKEDC